MWKIQLPEAICLCPTCYTSHALMLSMPDWHSPHGLHASFVLACPPRSCSSKQMPSWSFMWRVTVMPAGLTERVFHCRRHCHCLDMGYASHVLLYVVGEIWPEPETCPLCWKCWNTLFMSDNPSLGVDVFAHQLWSKAPLYAGSPHSLPLSMHTGGVFIPVAPEGTGVSYIWLWCTCWWGSHVSSCLQYAAAISSCHEGYGKISVFVHPLVKHFLKRVRQQRPVTFSLAPQWDSPLVLCSDVDVVFENSAPHSPDIG